MFDDEWNAVRGWWRGLTFTQRLGIRALGTAAVLALLVAAFPKLAAATSGAALAGAAAKILTYAFAADG